MRAECEDCSEEDTCIVIPCTEDNGTIHILLHQHICNDMYNKYDNLIIVFIRPGDHLLIE